MHYYQNTGSRCSHAIYKVSSELYRCPRSSPNIREGKRLDHTESRVFGTGTWQREVRKGLILRFPCPYLEKISSATQKGPFRPQRRDTRQLQWSQWLSCHDRTRAGIYATLLIHNQGTPELGKQHPSVASQQQKHLSSTNSYSDASWP